MTFTWDDGIVVGAAPVPPEGPVLLAWSLDPTALAALLVCATLYWTGLARVRRDGRPHPGGAARAWFAGLVVLAIALLSPIDSYADVSFTVHMTQHVLLAFVAPPLLALGAPATLALRALPAGAARRLAVVLRSRVVAASTRPVVAWALFAAVPWAVHFSPLFDLALRSDLWHAVEHALWVASALALWWPVVGADPSPHPWSYPTRLLTLFLAMPAMSFLSLAIFVAREPLYRTYEEMSAPWGGAAALASQRDAAVLMWLTSTFVLVPAMLVVAVAWKRHEDETQRRAEARMDAVAGS
jgi:putative membrane protein